MYTIVVADDEEELRGAIIRMIDWEAIGFQVVGEAENGIEALELVERMEPDLLLTDIRMPFLSGIELARRVREVRPTTQIAFLSGFDDFSYAQQAIQYNIISYLLKPISMVDLTAELTAIKEKLDHLFAEFQEKQKTQMAISEFLTPLVLDSFQGEVTPEIDRELEQQAIACGFLRSAGSNLRYCVMTTVVRGKHGENSTSSGHVHSVDTILKKYVKYASFYSRKRVVSVLVATPAAFDKYLHILVGDIAQSMERIMNLNCSLGVSRIYSRLSGSHDAYREAINAAGYSGRYGSSVHYIADEERGVGFDTESILSALAEMENLVRAATEEDLGQYLDELFDRMRQQGMSQAKMSFLIIQLISSVCRTLYSVADEMVVQELQNSILMREMIVFDSSLPELQTKFTVFCQEARNLIAAQRKKSGEVLCDMTLQMIEKDYANPDLSLLLISSNIGVSTNYLSTLIKKYTGKTFIEILTGKRMETAKQLLLSTPMKIREISERCGYNDQNYFSYSFKKYNGLSPNALRRQISKEEPV